MVCLVLVFIVCYRLSYGLLLLCRLLAFGSYRLSGLIGLFVACCHFLPM